MSSAAAVPLPEGVARRRYARYQLAVPFDVTVFRPGSVIRLSGRSQDVGEGGLRGVISGPALPGERVELTLTLPSSPQPLNMRAVVRHDSDLHCGFEFLSLEHSQLEQLQHLATHPGVRSALINGREWETGLEPPPRSDLELCAACGDELAEAIPVCLTCGAPRSEEEAGEPEQAVAPVLPASETKPARTRRSGPMMDSVVAVVFLVTLSIGLWQWMQAPADAAKDAQPSPVTVELENVFLRPVPVSEAEASRKAEARSSRVLAATTSLVKAVIGSAAPSRGESGLGSPGSAAAEPVRRREEPVAEPRRVEPTSAASENPPAMAAESAPALSSPPAAASAPAAYPLASEAPAENNSSAASDALSGAGLAGMLLQKVIPVYPAAARREGVQGQVVLKAVIGKDGTIAQLRPMQGPQALTAAAMEAVQHWRFRPYELKGKPVEVETDIRVNFALPKNR